MPGTSACFEKKSFGVINDLAKTEKKCTVAGNFKCKKITKSSILCVHPWQLI